MLTSLARCSETRKLQALPREINRTHKYLILKRLSLPVQKQPEFKARNSSKKWTLSFVKCMHDTGSVVIKNAAD